MAGERRGHMARAVGSRGAHDRCAWPGRQGRAAWAARREGGHMRKALRACRACAARARGGTRQGRTWAHDKDTRGARQGRYLGWTARQSGEGGAAIKAMVKTGQGGDRERAARRSGQVEAAVWRGRCGDLKRAARRPGVGAREGAGEGSRGGRPEREHERERERD